MAGFWKPGGHRPDLPLSLEVDRDAFDGVDPRLSQINRLGNLDLSEQRERLPIVKQRKALLYLVAQHATTIIVGETGSGKTTQIPQVSP